MAIFRPILIAHPEFPALNFIWDLPGQLSGFRVCLAKWRFPFDSSQCEPVRRTDRKNPKGHSAERMPGSFRGH